jgi:predicted nucleic acid-binding Zn ribbon protein
MKKWLKEEENELIDLLKDGLSYKDISIKLNRTRRSIKEKSNRLGLNSKFFYKELEKNCLECGEIIKVSNRNKTDMKRKFCSHSCSAIFNNKKRSKEVYDKISLSLLKDKEDSKNRNNLKNCIYCGNKIKRKNKYCDNKCKLNYEYENYIKEWKEGNKNGMIKGNYLSFYLRKYLFGKYNNKCSKCGWGEINEHTNKIPLEVEHIDGDHTNNKEDNLTLLCPNCHSLTKTYKGANKGKGRYNRMKRYYENKSY